VKSLDDGGFIYAVPGNIEVYKTTVNQLESENGMIFLSGHTSNITIDDCDFTGIVARDSSSILFSVSNNDGKILMQNSRISDSKSWSNLFTLTYSKMVIRNTIMVRNFADYLNNGFTLTNSDLECYSVTVDNKDEKGTASLVDVGFFNIEQSSSIKILDSEFSHI